MINENLQTRTRRLRYFYFTWISFLFTIFLINILEYYSLYVFLLFLALFSIFQIFYPKMRFNFIFISFWIIVWSIIWIHNINVMENNRWVIFKDDINTKKKTLISWEIKDIYKTSEYSNNYILKVKSLDTKSINSDINLLLTTQKWITYKPWDGIEFKSIIMPIEALEDFEYDKYMLTKDIYWKTNLQTSKITWNNLTWIGNSIYKVRISILNSINLIFPWDTAKLLAWIYLWVRSDFSQELQGEFNNSWLSHIIAVSWYNITVLIIFLSVIFRFLPDKLKLIIVIIWIWFFVMLVWNNIPALRAAIMWSIGFLAVTYWKRINIYSLLLATTILFVLINPYTLNYDVSFHLSFLAILWIVISSKYIEERLKYIPKIFWIKESLSTTLSVAIFTVPIMVVNFKRFSIISPISNILVTPLVPISMLFWWLSVVLNYISTNLWYYVWFLWYIPLKLILILTSYLGNLKYSAIDVDFWEISSYIMIIYFYSLFFLISYMHKNTIDLSAQD
jgi:ComEC/Rec2-related protein